MDQNVNDSLRVRGVLGGTQEVVRVRQSLSLALCSRVVGTQLHLVPSPSPPLHRDTESVRGVHANQRLLRGGKSYAREGD